MMNPRRITLTLGAAAGAAFVAALISVGAAPAASAVTGTDDDPFGDLFGTGGTNTWTTTADTDLATLSPTLAGDLDASVDNFEAGFNPPVAPDDRSASWPLAWTPARLAPTRVSVAFRTTPLVTSPWAWITRYLPAASGSRSPRTSTRSSLVFSASVFD
jgi:hypothetical protein